METTPEYIIAENVPEQLISGKTNCAELLQSELLPTIRALLREIHKRPVAVSINHDVSADNIIGGNNWNDALRLHRQRVSVELKHDDGTVFTFEPGSVLVSETEQRSIRTHCDPPPYCVSWLGRVKTGATLNAIT